MNEESYFKQYRQLNTRATDYVVFEVSSPYLDFGESASVMRTIESYEQNNEELPIIGEYAVLTNPNGLPVAIGKIEQVAIIIPNVEVKVEVIFV